VVVDERGNPARQGGIGIDAEGQVAKVFWTGIERFDGSLKLDFAQETGAGVFFEVMPGIFRQSLIVREPAVDELGGRIEEAVFDLLQGWLEVGHD
jgi:hypothetical protein